MVRSWPLSTLIRPRKIVPKIWRRDRLCGLVVSSWLQIQRPRFDFSRYQIFWEVAGLGQGPLNIATTAEELLGRKSSGSGLENRDYGHRYPLRWPPGTIYPQKLALTSTTSSARSIGIVRSWTKATELLFCLNWSHIEFSCSVSGSTVRATLQFATHITSAFCHSTDMVLSLKVKLFLCLIN
jgi:hypothetical protein